MSEGAKVCGSCGKDVTGRSRSKLPDGTYVCRGCMRDDRRATRRAATLRRNLVWPGIALLVLGIISVVVWATARPPARGRR